MNAIEIISKVRSAGGTITSDGGEITISAPAGTLSPEDRTALAEHRETLLNILPSHDSEREAIRWADTPAADEALDEARREWAGIADGSAYAQLARTIEQTFANHGIGIEAKFSREPEPITVEPILVETVEDGNWTQPDRGPFTIPAGTEGRLVVDLDTELAGDPGELLEMRRTVKTERKRGGDPVVVDLDGRARVMDRSKIRLGATP